MISDQSCWTKYVTYQLRKMTPLHVVLGFVIDEKGTNNLISIYTNRKGLAWSVTKAVEQSMLHTGWEKWHCFMFVLGFVIDEKGTNNLISIYMNKKGCQCIGKLFMRKYMNTLVTYSDCVDMLQHGYKDRKKRDKKLCLWIGLWIIAYVLGSWLLLVPKIMKMLYL